MKEYIERAALKRELAPYEENDFSQQMDVILAIVDAQPAADVVEVVRCRECQWYNAGANDSESWSDCTFRYGKHFNVSPDDFCSYGQRKIETVLPKSDAKDESLEADQ